jgi:1-acyl-sn-glycerol-3-phosphate acyltransferase
MLRTLLYWITLLTATPVLATVACLFFFREQVFLGCAHLWGRLVLAAAGVKVTREARAPLPQGPAIYMFNHASNFDIFAIATHLPPRARFIAKKQLGWIPIFGWALHLCGMILIDRENRQKALVQIQAVADKIKSGRPVLMAPEGTRSRDGALLPFKKGGFVMAILAGVPVVPVVIHGAYDIQPRGSLRINPGTVRVVFMAPESTAGLTVEDRGALIEKVRGVFLAELGRKVEG